MRTFRARRTRTAWIGIGAGCAILLAPVVAILLDPPDAGFWKPHWTMIFPVVLFGFFVYVIFASTCKMFTSYRIHPDGILIRVPPFHSRLFRREDIRQVQLLSASETHEIIAKSLEEQNRFSGTSDIVGYLRMIRNRAPEYRYFTIAPRVTLRGGERQETIMSVRADTQGGSILLWMKSGKLYYLTPEDAGGFWEAAGATGLRLTNSE